MGKPETPEDFIKRYMEERDKAFSNFELSEIKDCSPSIEIIREYTKETDALFSNIGKNGFSCTSLPVL